MSDAMLRSVFRRTLYDQRRALLGFSIGLIAFTAMIAGIWPTVRDQGAEFQKLIDTYPPALKAAFDIGQFDGAGILKGQLFSFMLPVLFLVFAIGRGADLIAGEEGRGALDMLLAQPLTRRRVMLQKAGGLLGGLAVLSVVLFASVSIAVVSGRMGVPLANVAGAILMLYLLSALFGIAAMTMSAFRPRPGVAIGLTAALSASAYILNAATRLVPSLEGAQYATPFYYYSGADPLVNGMSFVHALALAAATALLLTLAVWAFDRRDIGV